MFEHQASAKIRVRIGRRIVNIQLESARVRAIVPIAPETRQITGAQIRIIGEKCSFRSSTILRREARIIATLNSPHVTANVTI